MDSGILMIQDSILVCSPDPRIPHTAHEFYVFNSGREITRARVTRIPITDVVIKAIERIAEDQGYCTFPHEECRQYQGKE
jgi:hypothetical protein